MLRDSSKEALERLIYFVAQRDRIADAHGLDARFRLRRGPVVLFFGLIRPYKGVDVLLEALTKGDLKMKQDAALQGDIFNPDIAYIPIKQ